MIDDRTDDEPTMDEILTSIRKIIADEDDDADSDAPNKSGTTTPQKTNGSGGEILELTEKVEDDIEKKPLELGADDRVDNDEGRGEDKRETTNL
ncbi:MAG: hypothetical protein AAFY56_08405, partial [Pseudomonadota bacterium]